jgi:phytoene dehydrogenase-like protein
MQILVIGGGVAGLVCARTLHRKGYEVTLIEADDGLGGRVRSDRVEGFTLDRGFQVLFTAYPAAQRQLDFTALDLSTRLRSRNYCSLARPTLHAHRSTS